MNRYSNSPKGVMMAVSKMSVAVIGTFDNIDFAEAVQPCRPLAWS
jgi:hypothetical protein